MSEKPTGIGVDGDPTANVLELVNAAIRRVDDLRTETSRRIDGDVAHAAFVSLLRSEHAEKISELRASHQRDMDRAEADRLNSIRQVDFLNAAATASQTLTAVQALADGTSKMAESLRATSSSTIEVVNKRLSQLEQSSYEGVGKQKVSDPQMERLSSLVEQLAGNQSTSAGRAGGVDASWQKVFAIIGAIAAAAYIIVSLTKH
jgi:hypothetical protein